MRIQNLGFTLRLNQQALTRRVTKTPYSHLNLCLGEAVKKCSYVRQSVVYVVQNKCFPPSGDGSYGNNLFLGEEGHDRPQMWRSRHSTTAKRTDDHSIWSDRGRCWSPNTGTAVNTVQRLWTRRFIGCRRQRRDRVDRLHQSRAPKDGRPKSSFN
jgi:hypothetical protein